MNKVGYMAGWSPDYSPSSSALGAHRFPKKYVYQKGDGEKKGDTLNRCWVTFGKSRLPQV